MQSHTPIPASLDWHQSRRAQGLPTISVLVGPNSIGLREWRAWSSHHRRPIITRMNLALAAADWLDNQVDLLNHALDWLSLKSRVEGTERPDPARMTQYDLNRLWCDVPGLKSDPAAAIAYRVLDSAIRAHPLDRDETIRELGDAPVLAGLCGLIPETSWPGLLLMQVAEPDPEEFLLRSMRAFERLAALAPRLSMGICVPMIGFDAAMAHSTRTTALAREGEIRLTGVSAGELTDRLKRAGVPEPLPTDAILRLAADGLAEEVADAYFEAAVAMRLPTSDSSAGDDPHRSASERFLFEQLESMVETAGLFSPNRDLEFLHGTKAAEADLVAPELKLAIEIDGGYYHLNAEQYRRDRRKDRAYQRHGYWVLRFLAEDVVVDLEAILNTILEAVASRRSAPPEVPALA